MTFTAIPCEIREREGRLEVLFRGRPAFFWTTDGGLRPALESALEAERPVRVDWDPVSGQLLSIE